MGSSAAFAAQAQCRAQSPPGVAAQGWKLFAEAHAVQAGDQFSFELIGERQLVITLLTRAADGPPSLAAAGHAGCALFATPHRSAVHIACCGFPALTCCVCKSLAALLSQQGWLTLRSVCGPAFVQGIAACSIEATAGVVAGRGALLLGAGP